MLPAVLAAPIAHAGSADDGWYLAGTYGVAPRLFLRSELNDALVGQFASSPLTLSQTSVTRHGATWTAGVGYWFAEDLAFEAGYLNLGGVHYQAAGTTRTSGTSKPTNLDLHAKTGGATLALVWTAPLWNAWGMELRGGAFLGKTRTRYVSTVGGDDVAQAPSTKADSPLLGAGATYTATPHLVIKLNYAHLFGIKEDALEKKFPADVVTFGLAYAF